MCGMETKTILAYGYCRKTADLAPLGAGKRVYIDHDRKRRERAQMVADLRGGEVVRVLYLRDLGGSPVADRIWRERVEAKGATVEEVRPVKPAAVIGRPRKFDPTPEQDAALRAVWLDEGRSLADRCQGVIDIYGARVARFSLYRRYGKPGAPREEP
jgi:hypothetical protein